MHQESIFCTSLGSDLRKRERIYSKLILRGRRGALETIVRCFSLRPLGTHLLV
jgi:hypothetical protein